MKWLLVAALGAASIVPAASMAQSTRDAELAAAEQVLDDTYRALLARLSPPDRAALRRSQRAWARFRDADCTIGFPDRRDCRAQRADEREQQLRDSVYWDADGMLIRLAAPNWRVRDDGR